MGNREIEATLVIDNDTDAPLTLCLEPWADEHPIPPGKKFTVSAYGPRPAMLEIEIAPGRVTLYGWAGSILDDKPLPSSN